MEYKLTDKVIHIKMMNMKAQTMSMYKSNSSEYMEKSEYNGQLGLIIKLDFDDKSVLFYIK